MLKNHLKIAIRSLCKYRTYSSISILGFALGLTCFLILLYYIKGEMAYDQFHKQKDNIYRVLRSASIDDEGYLIGITSGPFGPALKNDFPGMIKSTVRVMPSNALVSLEDKSFQEDKFFMADPNFFETFSFPLVKGDESQVLQAPNSVVVSEEIAKKYFGDENPIGKTFEVDQEHKFMVTGVFKNQNLPSHLDFDFMASIKFMEQYDFFREWWSNLLFTYIVMEDPSQVASLEAKLPAFQDKYFGDDFERMNKRIDLQLQAVEDIYFGSSVKFDPAKHGNIQTVYILGMVALVILVIAIFNYINLTTAFAFRRAKEVGIRKILGSYRGALIRQFFVESFMIVLIALFISSCLLELIIPVFNNYFQVEVYVKWLSLFNGLILISLALIVSALASLYPAWFLSRMRPVQALKGKVLQTGFQNILIRKSLVIFQFSISVFMLIVTFMIMAQLNYMKNKELGFNQESVLWFNMRKPGIMDKLDVFKQELKKFSGIEEASYMSGQPGGFHDIFSAELVGSDQDYRLRSVVADYDYLKTLNLELVSGRDFSKEYRTDRQQAVILNELAVKRLGLDSKSVLGRELKFPLLDSVNHPVVGVVKDYHVSSLKDKMEPLVILLGDRFSIMSLRMNANQTSEAIAHVQSTWNKFSPDFPIEYHFLDESFQSLYKNEETQSKVFSLFASISILLACLGILGLASYRTQQKRKEIGIRKVLGASVKQILWLISHDFLVMVGVASFIGVPLAYYFLSTWLQDFAYRIHLGSYWMLFFLGAFLTLAIAWLTVTTQAWQASQMNPTDVLSEE